MTELKFQLKTKNVHFEIMLKFCCANILTFYFNVSVNKNYYIFTNA